MRQDFGKIMGKIVWITGASSGIGEALAVRYSQFGARVILSARRENELRRARERCDNPENHLILPMDMSNPKEFLAKRSEVLNHFGKIDVLINNAGISQRSKSIDTTLETERRIMEVNYFGTVALTKCVLPEMIKNQSGHIVVISSLMGKFSTPYRSTYAASKHALVGYFNALRAETWREGISVTLIFPGFVKTNISVASLKGDGSPHGIMDQSQKNGMSPDVCAIKIIEAVLREKDELIIGGSEKYGILLNRFFPLLLRKIIRKIEVK